MVECSADLKQNGIHEQQVLDVNSFYLYNEYLVENAEDIEEDQLESNAELVEGEVESLESILNELEFKKLSPDDHLS